MDGLFSESLSLHCFHQSHHVKSVVTSKEVRNEGCILRGFLQIDSERCLSRPSPSPQPGSVTHSFQRPGSDLRGCISLEVNTVSQYPLPPLFPSFNESPITHNRELPRPLQGHERKHIPGWNGLCPLWNVSPTTTSVSSWHGLSQPLPPFPLSFPIMTNYISNCVLLPWRMYWPWFWKINPDTRTV